MATATLDRERLRSSDDAPRAIDPFAMLRKYAAANPAPAPLNYRTELIRKQRDYVHRARSGGSQDTWHAMMRDFTRLALNEINCPRSFAFPMHQYWHQPGGAITLAFAMQLKSRGFCYNFSTRRLTVCAPDPELDDSFMPENLTVENHNRALRAWQERTAEPYIIQMCERVAAGKSDYCVTPLSPAQDDHVEIVDYLNEVLRDIPFACKSTGRRAILVAWGHRRDPSQYGTSYHGCQAEDGGLGAWVQLCESEHDKSDSNK